MNTKIMLFAAMSVALAGCGGGVSTPEQVRGTWGTDCSTPTLQVDDSALHILYPNKQDFTLTASDFDGKNWNATFENGGKKITDGYVLEDGTLRLENVTVDGNSFSGDKTKLNKCG
ncbi:MAG: hypothetical protein JO348_00705 [Alphaproteobacteria bacterium]|nr:hypothetical protein [Alphaproteobacteria bacterium]